MPRKSILSDAELDFLQELARNNTPFMIVGLSSAALQGAPVVTQDVDLWFKNLSHPGIRKALRKVGGAYVPPPPGSHNPPMFAGDAVELFDIVTHMDGLGSFDKEYKAAQQISMGRFTVRILPLRRVIASKKKANRPKDRLVLPVLRNALAAIESAKQSDRLTTNS